MKDADAVFARLVYLCEKHRAGEPPTMHDVEAVATALLLDRTGWLKHRGYTQQSARDFVGRRYTAVFDRVLQVINEDTI